MTGIEYHVVNTDAQALLRSDVPIKIRIGDHLTEGKGAGRQPGAWQTGRRGKPGGAPRGAPRLRHGLHRVRHGGGTGTGAAPVIAEVVKETGALTVGIVNPPFTFEGTRRMRAADEGIERLRQSVDTLLVIPNERLHLICDQEITAENAFRIADDVLRLAVQSIAELVTVPGEINLTLPTYRRSCATLARHGCPSVTAPASTVPRGRPGRHLEPRCWT